MGGGGGGGELRHPSVRNGSVDAETSASPLPVIQQALDEIVRKMGLTELKPKQLEAILAVVSGNDTFLSLPTWVTASQSSSFSSLILTRSGKYGRSSLLPLLELLALWYCPYLIVLMTLFYAFSAFLHPKTWERAKHHIARQ